MRGFSHVCVYNGLETDLFWIFSSLILLVAYVGHVRRGTYVRFLPTYPILTLIMIFLITNIIS